MIRIAVPAATTLITVALLVGVAGWNRSRQPRQVIVLTERELPLESPGSAGDNAGLRLRVAIEHRHEPLDAMNWLNDDRLRALGFMLNVPASAPEAATTYGRMPPRVGWVVLEHGGPAYRDIERRRELRSEQWRGPRGMWSRLVPVDAGPDPDALLARYPSGHLIMPAIFGVVHVSPSSGGPHVYGMLREVVPSTIAVPHALGSVLDGLPSHASAEEQAPRYDAELAMGPLGVPYVRSIRRSDGSRTTPVARDIQPRP